MEFNQQLYAKRRRSNAIGLTLSLGAMALGLFVLLWILSVLLSNGFAALDWNMFTQSTPAPGSDGGGLANAIVGSLMMLGLTVLALGGASWPRLKITRCTLHACLQLDLNLSQV